METNNKSNNQFIVCPACSGTGKKNHGLICGNCLGMGLGMFRREKFLYWGIKYSKVYIKLKHIRRGIHLIINLTSLIIGLIGIFSLGWWVWHIGGNVQGLNELAFWRVKDLLILVFWLSIVVWMFVFYRISEDEAFKLKIDKIKYNEKNKQYQLPNNWDELKRMKPKYKIDVSKAFDYNAIKIVDDAYNLASDLKHAEVNILHLFFNLLKDKETIK